MGKEGENEKRLMGSGSVIAYLEIILFLPGLSCRTRFGISCAKEYVVKAASCLKHPERSAWIYVVR